MLMTALATPFWNGKVDVESFERLLQGQRHADALLCCGTTGEGELLSAEESLRLVDMCKGSGKPVWAAVSGGTDKASRAAEKFARQGAEGIMITPPAFFGCTDEGYALHVEKIGERCGLPVMLYNAPARCGYDVPLHSVPKCVRWIKDAGKGDRFAKYKGKLLCGDEVNLLNFAEAGAVGVVSVLANAAPLLTKRAEQNFLDKNVQKNTHRCENFVTNEEFTPQERQAFFHLSKACFVQKNPIPIKYVLQKLGVFRDCSPRLPLTAATERTRKLCDDALGRFWQYVR